MARQLRLTMAGIPCVYQYSHLLLMEVKLGRIDAHFSLCNGRAAFVQSLSTVRIIYTPSAPHTRRAVRCKQKRNRSLKVHATNPRTKRRTTPRNMHDTKPHTKTLSEKLAACMVLPFGYPFTFHRQLSADVTRPDPGPWSSFLSVRGQCMLSQSWPDASHAHYCEWQWWSKIIVWTMR